MSAASPPTAVIGAEGLTKRFGPVRALDHIEIEVGEGESVALFGPNGAGKTTLVRILCMSLRPTAGRVFASRGSIRATEDLEIRRRIGLISHQSFLYDDLTAQTEPGVLRPASRRAPTPPGAARRCLRRFELESRADDAIGTFSRGMQQRVSLARSLVHDPSDHLPRRALHRARPLRGGDAAADAGDTARPAADAGPGDPRPAAGPRTLRPLAAALPGPDRPPG